MSILSMLFSKLQSKFSKPQAKVSKPKSKVSKSQPEEVNVAEALKEAFLLGEGFNMASLRKAVKLYADIVRRSPSVLIAWFNMGVIQSRMGNWKEAVLSFRQAEADNDLGLVASFAKLKPMVEKGQQPSDADFPEQFRGKNRGALGVQGACLNAANELRNRGYECTLEAKGGSCSIHCDTGRGKYVISVYDMYGGLFKNVWRMEGDKEINIGEDEPLNETDQEIENLEIGHLPLAQVPVSTVAEPLQYRAARQVVLTGGTEWDIPTTKKRQKMQRNTLVPELISLSMRTLRI
jgi:tetratricopeptide (TPR) repeat protein